MASPPAYLTGETSATIQARLAQDIRAAGYDLAEGSVEYDLVRAAALLFYDLGVIGTFAIDQRLFLRTAPGPKLDDHGVHYGLPRLGPVKATGEVTFTGTDGTVVPSGTVVSTAATLAAPAAVYETTEDVTIASGSATASIQAQDGGANGNVGANQVRLLAAPQVGVASVTNVVAVGDEALGFTRGADTEGHEAYRARLIARAAAEPGFANVAYYEAVMLRQNDVGWVLVEPRWDGEGTVRIVYLTRDGGIPGAPAVAALQAVMDPAPQGHGLGLAEIDHVVTIVAPTSTPITVTVPGLVPDAGVSLATAKANLESAVNAYIDSVNPGGLVIVRDVEAVIIESSGVRDLGDVLLNGVRANLALTTTQKANLSLPLTYT